MVIYDIIYQKHHSKSLKQEGLVFLKKHKIEIRWLQMYDVVGYSIGYRCHELRRKKNK